MTEESLHKQFAPYVPKKGEEYMCARQLTHFRNILATLKSELMQDIERTVHTMQDEATVFADPQDDYTRRLFHAAFHRTDSLEEA